MSWSQGHAAWQSRAGGYRGAQLLWVDGLSGLCSLLSTRNDAVITAPSLVHVQRSAVEPSGCACTIQGPPSRQLACTRPCLHDSWHTGDTAFSSSAWAGARTRSSMPSFLSCSTTEPRLERRISGYVCSCRSFLKLASVYRRKHLPGCVRPARPARWCALACRRTQGQFEKRMVGV